MSVDIPCMTLEEKMVFICRRCRHCYERHTTPRIEQDSSLSHRRTSRYVCMVHAKAMSNNLKSSITQVVPCAAQWRGKWRLLDFEMREVDE